MGDAEQGKTTYMVREIIKKLNDGTYSKGYSNITIKDSRVEKVSYEEIKDLRADNKDGVPTALFGIDQLHKYLNSRQSGCSRNIYMNDQIIESRQHGFDVIGTTWARGSIDLNYRRFSPMLVLASGRNRKGFHYTMVDSDRGAIGQGTMPYEQAADVWKRFDTTELVPDIPPSYDPRFSRIENGKIVKILNTEA